MTPKIITVKTHSPQEVLDITTTVQNYIDIQTKPPQLCHIFVLHTTAAITTADLDPGTDIDYLSFMESVTPKIQYQHPHNPKHAPDHIWASIIGPDVSIPVIDGKLDLGTWQRIVLIEMDGPRERTLRLTLLV